MFIHQFRNIENNTLNPLYNCYSRMPGGFQGMAILGLYRDIIQAPWTRASGYIVGLAVGYILYKTKCKINMHWVS